jgi:hypothetical protein
VVEVRCYGGQFVGRGFGDDLIGRVRTYNDGHPDGRCITDK